MSQAASMSPPRFTGLKILVVEDSFLAATSMKTMLAEFGCTVIGPVPSVREAVRMLNEISCDAAILDINLAAGETVEPVAQMLDTMKLPFVFVTGYTSPRLLSEQYRSRPRLMKPIDRRMLLAMMLREFRLPPMSSN